MQRHRHSEFIRFLNAVEHQVPAGKLIHAVLDNYATPSIPSGGIRSIVDLQTAINAYLAEYNASPKTRRCVWRGLGVARLIART